MMHGVRRVAGARALRATAWMVGTALLVSSCGPPGRAEAPLDPPAIAPAAGEGAAGETAGCEKVTLIAPSSVLLDEMATQDRRHVDPLVAAAQKAVRDSQYKDVDALAELSRLQLWRSAQEESHDGPSDLDGAHRNAQRAMAVDSSHSAGRLALALTTATRVIQTSGARDPAHRLVALGLVDLAVERALDGAPPAMAAAGHTLRGYLMLDRGEPGEAGRAFDQALAQDAQAVGAWVGKGHVARSQRDLVAASDAYERALAIDAADLEARAALDAATRCEGLKLTLADVTRPELSRLIFKPLAPPANPPTPCPQAALADARNETLCRGRASLSQARTGAERKAAVTDIIAGWQALRPACEAGEPVCGGHVPAALLDAMQAQDGQPARAITLGRILGSSRYKAFRQAGLEGQVALLIADRYYELGIYDLAANHYERHVKLAPKEATADAARERASAIRMALGNTAARVKGPSVPLLLAFAVRRLAADPTWSPAAERIAAQVPQQP